eukprot:365634-Chlamydomonas_euryale.AAC.1
MVCPLPFPSPTPFLLPHSRTLSAIGASLQEYMASAADNFTNISLPLGGRISKVCVVACSLCPCKRTARTHGGHAVQGVVSGTCGSGLRVEGLVVQGIGLRIKGSRIRAEGQGLAVQG